MHGAVISMVPSNSIHVAQPPLLIPNMPSGSLHLQGGTLPPFPPGPPPASQMMPATENVGDQPQSAAFSGLISSLMAQGLISLTKPTPIQVLILVRLFCTYMYISYSIRLYLNEAIYFVGFCWT